MFKWGIKADVLSALFWLEGSLHCGGLKCIGIYFIE